MFPPTDRNHRVRQRSAVAPSSTLTEKPPAFSDLLAFAKEATATLHKLAEELAREAGIKAYCSSLASKLWAVKKQLSQLDELTEADTKKMFQLLYCLEQLSSPLSSSCHRPDVTTQTFQRCFYPNLHALTSRHGRQGKVNIRELATIKTDRARKRRGGISKSLSAFAESEPVQRGPDLHELATIPETTTSADDYSLYLNHLHSTLSEYCFCRELRDACRINTILRLKNWKRATDIEDAINFDLLFLGHPHTNEHSEERCEWQDTCICVALSSRTSLIEWEGLAELQEPQSTTYQPPPGNTAGFVPKERFCSWITDMHQGQCRAVYVASGGKLRHKETDLVSGEFLLNSSSVSLSTLLDRGLLGNVQQKTLLFYLLVKAVCEFYYSDWMTKEWSKHSIHFMFQTDGSSHGAEEAQPYAIHISEPFIEADFKSPLSTEPAEFKVPTQSHRYPKILALGIMLLEIELGKHIVDQNGHENEPIQNAKHIAASRILFTEEWRNNGGFKFIKQVIEICVTPDKVKLGTDPDNLRNVLFQEVVLPCRNFFLGAWEEEPDTFNIRLKVPRETNSEDRRNQTPAQQLLPFPVQNMADNQGQCDLTVQRSRTTRRSNPGDHKNATPKPTTGSNVTTEGCCFDSASAIPSEPTANIASGQQWFDWLKDAHEFLELGRKEWTPKDKKRMVKVALLDTGLDMTHPLMKNFLDDEQILDPFDFIEDSAEIKDTDGHGTHGIHLLFKTAPFVKVYPARVFKHSHADANTSSLVTKAIMRAVDVCKVNIISMSFAFEDDIPEIQSAIRHATSQNVLVFAAASNNNGNRTNPIGFPARVREHVICINSSSSQNHKSNFSPSGAEWRRNFSVVGEGLEAAWAPTQGLMVRCGTSCATPIGAGIAALVIEYSRQKLSPRIEQADDLFTIAGMNKVLFECMTERRTGSEYNYIKPWMLFRRGVNPLEVSMRINNALSEVHR